MALKPKSHYSRQKKHFRYMDITKTKTLFQARKQIYKTYSATKVKIVKLKIFIAICCAVHCPPKSIQPDLTFFEIRTV